MYKAVIYWNCKFYNSMAYRFFTIPIRSAEAAQAELNGFLRGHRVLSVERRWVDQGESSFWAFCVDYLESSGAPAPPSKDRDGPPRNKVDYRERLSPVDFAVFARLRDLRKEIAQTEAVPVYTVFTNEQLAQMVQTRATTKAALETIAGVGDARIEKYGPRVLELLRQSGSGEVLLRPRPLRTGHESCPSSSSSLHKRPSRDAAAFVRRSRTWICRWQLAWSNSMLSVVSGPPWLRPIR